MEKEITNILDNLTVEQTERWIDDSMEMKLNSRDRRRIKNAVFEKTGSKKRQRAALPRKLAACAAAFAVVFASLAVIGFDNVAAAIQKLFTFVPGIGIVEKDDADIYTAELLTGYIQTENAKVTFVNAVYADGILAVQIAVAGKETNREHFFEDYTVYINQKSINLADVIQLCGSASDYYDTAFYFEKETAPPKEGDIFEVAVAGFSERISFSMVPCRDYDDFAKIGPYDTQNGISLVTTAQRFGDQLAVWCYPHQTAESAYKNDEICGIGFASPSSVVFYPPGGWEKWSANPDEYIQTPGGKIPQNMDDNGLNRQYKNRLLF
ncbi:MAG: hypothetical protein FWE80_09515, partial [Oscillospiraceae bacterium]|nr:hypothetical protein [Oscillospiraceae bacterium]